jgi:hypothetical protein
VLLRLPKAVFGPTPKPPCLTGQQRKRGSPAQFDANDPNRSCYSPLFDHLLGDGLAASSGPLGLVPASDFLSNGGSYWA